MKIFSRRPSPSILRLYLNPVWSEGEGLGLQLAQLYLYMYLSSDNQLPGPFVW